MITDISQVITNDGAVQRIDGTVDYVGLEFNGNEIRFLEPVSAIGEIKNISGVLCLSLNCLAHFETFCSRCSSPVEETLEFTVNERFARESSDEEVIIIDSHELDLDETVVKGFCSELPINFLCSEDCKGLCHVCGCNLNHEECDCKDDNIDPRLAALKDFL